MDWVKLGMSQVLLWCAQFLLWVDGHILRGADWYIQRVKWLTPTLLDEEEMDVTDEVEQEEDEDAELEEADSEHALKRWYEQVKVEVQKHIALPG